MVQLCRIVTVAAAFTSTIAAGRIDTHIHALPPPYIEALEAAGGDLSGYPTPNWTLDATIRSMDAVNTGTAILSLSTPGVPIVGPGQAGRDLARTLNEYFGNSTEKSANYSDRLGFFGVLPDWQDVNGTLRELDYLYKEQKLCNGVTVYTSYGNKLLSDPLFTPIWVRLQKYKALVFLHPGVLAVEPKFIASTLPQPIVDYPIATTRTAVDLVMTKTLRQYPDVDIILSHAGGTLPFIAARAIGSLVIPEISEPLDFDSLQAKKDLGRFFYDIALSTSPAQLHGLLDVADHSHILFGSDFPYAPQAAISALTAQYALFVSTDERGDLVRPEKLRENAFNLLKKHSLENQRQGILA